jgi:hypothetical protein
VNRNVIGRHIEYVDDKDITLFDAYCWAGEASTNCCYYLLMAQPLDS